MIQVVPNSHFWTSLSMLSNYIDAYKKGMRESPAMRLEDYIQIGIKNTLKEGYDLRKRRNKK